jgi:hypothetical protein
VFALPVDAGTDLNRLDWDQIWDASPPSGTSTSKFQIDLDTSTSTSSLCGTYTVGRCRLTVPNPELKARLVSALETEM